MCFPLPSAENKFIQLCHGCRNSFCSKRASEQVFRCVPRERVFDSVFVFIFRLLIFLWPLFGPRPNTNSFKNACKATMTFICFSSSGAASKRFLILCSFFLRRIRARPGPGPGPGPGPALHNSLVRGVLLLLSVLLLLPCCSSFSSFVPLFSSLFVPSCLLRRSSFSFLFPCFLRNPVPDKIRIKPY